MLKAEDGATKVIRVASSITMEALTSTHGPCLYHLAIVVTLLPASIVRGITLAEGMKVNSTNILVSSSFIEDLIKG